MIAYAEIFTILKAIDTPRRDELSFHFSHAAARFALLRRLSSASFQSMMIALILTPFSLSANNISTLPILHTIRLFEDT
jgi:hypothetical protein